MDIPNTLQDMEDMFISITLVESTTVHISYAVNVFSVKPFVPGADFLDNGTRDETTERTTNDSAAVIHILKF